MADSQRVHSNARVAVVVDADTRSPYRVMTVQTFLTKYIPQHANSVSISAGKLRELGVRNVRLTEMTVVPVGRLRNPVISETFIPSMVQISISRDAAENLILQRVNEDIYCLAGFHEQVEVNDRNVNHALDCGFVGTDDGTYLTVTKPWRIDRSALTRRAALRSSRARRR